jgi:gamma-polyglutamate synthase
MWECMGLSPAYVKVLQRHWMRDDISTITNTYPDHEDLQGPAGRNIPEVMTNFIPEGGTLLTTEEQMRPILADAARRLGTRLVPVGWLEAGLIPSDCLKRFPYEEHPFNIALCLQVAEELGVDRDRALKEMADRVVPDLGVLKSFPPAPMRTRRLEFVNGMSANERFGAMSNWVRMGFGIQDPEREPGVWLTTVVNNRADRVPRSRVFANMIANDLSADRHVLIGSNLEGLQGYIEEAWAQRAAGMTLWPQAVSDAEADPLVTLATTARWLRVPRDADAARAFLRAMLDGQPGELDREALAAGPLETLEAELSAAGVAAAANIVAQYRRATEAAAAYETLAARIRSGGDRASLDAAFVRQATAWFRSKIVVVEDFYASGDQVVQRVLEETPPGLLNRVMGIQNIKGTGLDFVYCWQAWDVVHTACRMARSRDAAQAREGLETLASFQEFGLLAEETVRTTLEELRAAPPVAGAAFLDAIELARSNLDRQMAELRTAMGMTRTAGGLSRVVDMIEGLLDAGDALRRRRKAEQVYRDLAAERVSLERAALELKKLTARQKGGWLAEEIERRGGQLRAVLRALPGRRHREGGIS